MSEVSKNSIVVPNSEVFSAVVRGIDAKYGADQVPNIIKDIRSQLSKGALMPFGYLAERINPVDHEIGMRKYDHYSLVRALGFGATAGLVLISNARQENISDQDMAEFWQLEALTVTDVGRRSGAIMRVLGDPTKAWLQRSASSIIPDSTERRWYPVAAGLAVDLLSDKKLSHPQA